MKNIFLFLLVFSLSCKSPTSDSENSVKENWESIFNGVDLSGWTPKIAGYPSGDNFENTFRVVDGTITVSYEGYDSFANSFGHLFYKEELSHYKLRLKYRFIGEQAPGGEGWAFKNSGIMYHGQTPESMGLDQGFPISLEGQFLGGNGTDERPTANLCTPGMHVMIADTLVTGHCITANAPTFHGEEWVEYEMVVKGNGSIHHLINSDTVFHFTNPTYGGRFLPENSPFKEGDPVTKGTISLQSESHPIQFKDIEIMRLKGQE